MTKRPKDALEEVMGDDQKTVIQSGTQTKYNVKPLLGLELTGTENIEKKNVITSHIRYNMKNRSVSPPLLGTRDFQHTLIVDKSSQRRSRNSVFYTHLLHNWLEYASHASQTSGNNGSGNCDTKHLHKLPKGIGKRGRKYYFRRRMPADVQNQIGKREIWRSLKTDSLQIALRRLPLVSIPFANTARGSGTINGVIDDF